MICTICGAVDKHVAASCPYRPCWRDRAIAFFFVVFLLCGYAWGHSWYDPDCCGDKDCEPVNDVSFVAFDPGALPVMVVTTSLGTKAVTADTKIRESKDGRMHACIYMGRLICLYMPPAS